MLHVSTFLCHHQGVLHLCLTKLHKFLKLCNLARHKCETLWWWYRNVETCRSIYYIKIYCCDIYIIVHFCILLELYTRILLRCTDPWTLKIWLRFRCVVLTEATVTMAVVTPCISSRTYTNNGDESDFVIIFTKNIHRAPDTRRWCSSKSWRHHGG